MCANSQYDLTRHKVITAQNAFTSRVHRALHGCSEVPRGGGLKSVRAVPFNIVHGSGVTENFGPLPLQPKFFVFFSKSCLKTRILPLPLQP